MSDPKVSIYCPYCKRYTSLSVARRIEQINAYDQISIPCLWEKTLYEKWWIGICNYCDRPILVRNDGEEIYPYPLPSPSDERIPVNIRKDLDEAKLCFSVRAYRASAIMARRALQSLCIDKGAKKENLSEQIRELADNGLITKDLKEWADAVRYVGNDAAHPGDNEVNGDDANDIIHLTEQFLHVIYVAPAIAAKHSEKRKKQN